jgi:rod shape-determining protein MreC
MKRRTKTQILTRNTPTHVASVLALGAALVLCGLLIVVERVKPEALQSVKSTGVDVIYPIAELISSPKRMWANVTGNISAFIHTYRENESLKLANAELLKWQVAAKEIRQENENLRSLLHMVPEKGVHYVTTRLVADIGATSSFTALISGGSKDGIKKHQAVISSEGLIGRVIEVGANSSRVLLLADSNSHIPVVGERGRQKAMLSGRGRGEMALKYVERGDQFAVGERLVTSGDGGLLPPGILVGTVNSVDGVMVNVLPIADANHASVVTVIDYQF